MRRAAFVGVLAIAVGACSPGGAEGPETTVPTRPDTVATSAVADPFAIPAVIDAPYIERVLAALNKVEGDLVRDLVAKNTLDAQASIRLRAIYNEPQFSEEVASRIRLLGRGLSGFKRPPGDRRTTVTEIEYTSPTCILASVAHDYSNVLEASQPQQDSQEVDIVTLRLTEIGADPGGLNPTPWSISNAEIIEVGAAAPVRAKCDG